MRGVDYAPYIDINSVEAVNNVEKSRDGLRFTVYLNGELAPPRAGMEVVWQRWDTSTGTEISREFGGVVQTVEEIDLGNELQYDVTCHSYLRWFDRRLVTGFFQQQSAESFINTIVSAYCPGFTTEYVTAPYTIIPQYSNFQRPSQLIKQACDQIGYGWYIDAYRRLHTFRAEDFPSPLPSNILDVDNDTTNYGDLVLTEDAEQVFNRFTVRGYKQRSGSPYTLQYVGDGYSKQFQLGYRFSSAKGDSRVTINGVEYPVKRDILDGLPGQSNDPNVAYVHWTQHTLRFANAPAAGAIISFTGYPLVDKTRTDQDDASIEYMRLLEDDDYSDGIYELADTDKSLTSSTNDAITAKIELMALKYGFPTIAGNFSSFTQGWQAGQMFRMVSTRRFGGLSADSKYYIHRVSKKWIAPHHDAPSPIQYTIEFSDKPYLLA